MTIPGTLSPGERTGSTVLVVTRDGHILLQQRDDDVPPAGYGRWTIPGGGREGNESPRTTACREFAEETGVQLRHLRYWGDVTPERAPGWRVGRSHIYFALDDVPRDTITVGEGLDFRYWAPADLDGLPMNPPIRAILREMLADPRYRAIVDPPEAAVIALSRWGDALVRRDPDGGRTLPRAPIAWDEAPDAAAFRLFDATTGIRLEGLSLFELVRAHETASSVPVHVYFHDPDIDLAMLPGGRQAFAYAHPDRLDEARLAPWDARLLERFFASTQYRALFH